MIAAAHSRVKSWLEKQSVLWMEKAAKLYAEHESNKKSVVPVNTSPNSLCKTNSYQKRVQVTVTIQSTKKTGYADDAI